jgi:hypothetical protein
MKSELTINFNEDSGKIVLALTQGENVLQYRVDSIWAIQAILEELKKAQNKFIDYHERRGSEDEISKCHYG